jgi:hypothetical protein
LVVGTRKRAQGVEGAPEDQHGTVFIPNGLYGNQSEVYEDGIKQGKISPRITLKYFYHIWQKVFWWCFIKSWTHFAKCDECTNFKNEAITATEADFMNLTTKQKVHKGTVTLGRSRFMLRQTLAKLFPKYFVHIEIDGMDNAKTNVPRTRYGTHAKTVEATGEPLQTRLLGCLVESIGFFAFWTWPTYRQGTALTWTALIWTINFLISKEGFVAPILFLQLDNCGKDNKNQIAFAFLGYLVYVGVFKEVYMHFLPVGHTHIDIDQRFSNVSQKISAKSCLSLEGLIEVCKELFQPDATNKVKYREDIQVDQVADVLGFLEHQTGVEGDKVYPLFHQFHGQGTYRDAKKEKRSLKAFKIFKPDGDLYPCIMYKEHDESTPWLGQWDSPRVGIPIFQSNTLEFLRDLVRRPLKRMNMVRVKNLMEVKKKWDAIVDLIGKSMGPVDDEDVPHIDGSNGNRVLPNDTSSLPSTAGSSSSSATLTGKRGRQGRGKTVNTVSIPNVAHASAPQRGRLRRGPNRNIPSMPTLVEESAEDPSVVPMAVDLRSMPSSSVAPTTLQSSSNIDTPATTQPHVSRRAKGDVLILAYQVAFRFWRSFFANQKLLWEGVDESIKEQPDTRECTLVKIPESQHASRWGGLQDEDFVIINNILEALDDNTKLDVPSEVVDQIKSVQDAEKEMRLPFSRVLTDSTPTLTISTNRLPGMSHYLPSRDAFVGEVAVVNMRGGTRERGWDLVLIQKIYFKQDDIEVFDPELQDDVPEHNIVKLFSGLYMEPGVYSDRYCAMNRQWPQDWINMPLKKIEFKPRPTDRAYSNWNEVDLKVSNIWYSVKLNKSDKKIPHRALKNVKSAVSAIEENMTCPPTFDGLLHGDDTE